VHPGGDEIDLKEPQWPDFKAGMPSRPSIVVITKDGGGKIGA
jgi:secreted PhoX family phosphatase